MAERIRIEGMRELRTKMLRLAPTLRDKALKQAVGRGAKIIRDDAISRAPVDTGKLQSNIIAARRSRDKDHDEEYIIGVRSKGKASHPKNAFYWRFLEFGTVKLTKRPFLRPAFEANVARVIETVRSSLAKALERIVR